MPTNAFEMDQLVPMIVPDSARVPLEMESQAAERRRTARRGSMEQGRALEMLGHAVEYLVDSRLFGVDQRSVRDNQEAVQILMRLSRAVFLECPEVVPMGQRLSLWAEAILTKVIGAPAR